MFTFPGYSDIAKFTEWSEDIYNLIFEISNITWAVFNTVSTVVTIIGI